MDIRPAYDEVNLVRTLFSEYRDMLGIDLCFQSFSEELASLPGKYAPPDGRLYIAYCDDTPAGCIALRPLDHGRCEMKRLYVRPQFRSRGLGWALAQRVIDDAIQIGYRQMVLDTLSTLEAAVALYRELGFKAIDPYYHNPIHNVLYLGLDLSASSHNQG